MIYWMFYDFISLCLCHQYSSFVKVFGTRVYNQEKVALNLLKDPLGCRILLQ